jgi:type II secretory pathway pseudopilin PulG
MLAATNRAFSVVELIVIISVLGILAMLTGLSYSSWQQTMAKNSVLSDMKQAASALHNYKNFKNNYPPNLAGTGFAASPGVSLTLSTNAPSIGVYQDLQPDQDAQLFLNACNANLFQTPNNTACSFQGNSGGTKIHVAGTNSSNSIWNSPINQSDVTLSCNGQQAACDQALTSLISQFTAQGGTFPVTVPLKNVALPEPTQVPNGPANRYCLEGRASNFPAIVYFALSDNNEIIAGGCPNDPSLHYYQESA